MHRGGLGAMEITQNTPGALEGIGRVRSAVGARLFVGAGTILNLTDARKAIDAGAHFIVTPTLQTDTIALCRKRSVPIFCGCLTPTEMLAAHDAGADFVKVFPAVAVGPAFCKAVLEPMPFLKLVPTGGVSAENLGTFFAAGCVAVAAGGNLVSREILQQGNWEALEQRSRRFTEALRTARGGGGS
jgi:2-dehydro-3-deoxyphosphogluconate aldolase/(4S)-4-hydroxy-2-oxoglutarate aldolase